jgi:hypothetical protein
MQGRHFREILLQAQQDEAPLATRRQRARLSAEDASLM